MGDLLKYGLLAAATYLLYTAYTKAQTTAAGVSGLAAPPAGSPAPPWGGMPIGLLPHGLPVGAAAAILRAQAEQRRQATRNYVARGTPIMQAGVPAWRRS